MEHSEEKVTSSQTDTSSVRYSLSPEGETSDKRGQYYGQDMRLQTENKPKQQYCTNCGHLLPTDCKFCPNCGHKVEAVTPPPPPPPPPPRSSPYTIPQGASSSLVTGYTPTPAPKKQKQLDTKTILIIAGVLLAIVIIIIAASDSDDPKLTPVAEPRSGEILSGVEDYNGSTITITASSGESCVVKLKTRSGVTRLSFYVRAGTSVTVGVPSEYLYVYFASGDTWYGNEHLFGEHTSYSMDDDLRNFTNYTWEYTLNPVSSGNFSETPIDADEFK